MRIEEFTKGNKNTGARSAKRTHSDFVFYRMITVFFALVAFVAFEFYAHGASSLRNAGSLVGVLSYVFLALFVLSAVLHFVRFPKGVFAAGKPFSFGFIALLSLALSVFVSLTYQVSDDFSLVILAFAAAALAFVGYTFSRDFFILSCVSVVSILLAAFPVVFVYGNSASQLTASYATVAISFAISIAFCVLSAIACFGKNEKLSAWFFNMGYVRRYPLFVLPAVFSGAALLRLIFPSFFSYALIASIVCYVVFLVIYAFDSAK